MRAKVAVGKLYVNHVARKLVNGKVNWHDDYHFRISMKRAREIGLKEGEYYILAMIPAEWYDLIDLNEKGRLYKALPEDVKKHVDWLKRAEKEGVEIEEEQ